MAPGIEKGRLIAQNLTDAAQDLGQTVTEGKVLTAACH
jgi:hypothetical protein